MKKYNVGDRIVLGDEIARLGETCWLYVGTIGEQLPDGTILSADGLDFYPPAEEGDNIGGFPA